ncbi:MAG: PepSY domain-containing protein [Acaryochloris sp. SU_5_25]|nr:PepSY domain-containing protein [Acaryochloris sp. SU_5_25]
MKLRNRIIALHGIVGLLGGLLLMIMGLTGSAIVFHQEIDHALNPHLMQVVPQGERVAIESFLETAQRAIPGSRLESIQIPQSSDETYRLDFKSADEIWRQVFVHPYTGEILGNRWGDRTLIGFLYAVHHDLFAGKLGLYLVGISGLVLIVQAITGLVLWTGWRKLATGFRIRWGAPIRLVNFDLHNVGGVIANVFLLITGVTGVVIVAAHILLEPPAMAELPPPFQSEIAPSELLRRAEQAIPEGTAMSISFPDAQTMIVTQKLPQNHPRFYFSSVTLEGATGKILDISKVVEPPPMWQFLMPIADLHFGTFGGLPTRILYVFVGFMPTVLFVTGLVNWRRRRRLGARRETTISLAQHPQESRIR